MRAKTFAEHRIHNYLEARYPGLDAKIEFSGREAIVTDCRGDRVKVVYEDGEVYEEFA